MRHRVTAAGRSHHEKGVLGSPTRGSRCIPDLQAQGLVRTVPRRHNHVMRAASAATRPDASPVALAAITVSSSVSHNRP